MSELKLLDCVENGAGTCRNELLFEAMQRSCNGFKEKNRILAEELENLRAAKGIDEIERLREAQRWIPVGERMPEFELGTASKYVEVAYRIPGSPNYLRGDVQYWEKYGWVFKWENGKAETFDDYGYIVEFWKPPFPLPQPPQEA